MNWKLEATLRSKDGSRGHRLFSGVQDGEVLIAIADNSGPTLLIRQVEIHDTQIRFAVRGGWACDDLTEANVREVWRVVRALNIPMEGETWIGKLVVAAIRAEEGA